MVLIKTSRWRKGELIGTQIALFIRMTRFIVPVFILFCSPLLSANNLCTVNLDKNSKRRIDIEFPSKTISVVGHQHPYRGENSFELYLWNLLIDHRSRHLTSKELRDFKSDIDSYVNKNSTAMEHWEEDRINLLGDISTDKYNYVSIEYNIDSYQMMMENNGQLFIDGTYILSKLGYDTNEITNILSIAMTPAVYLKNRHPGLFKDTKVISVEPTKTQIVNYDAIHCAIKDEEESNGLPPEKTQALDDLFKSLNHRHKDQKRTLEQFSLGNNAVGRHLSHLHSAEKKIMDVELLVDIFVRHSKLSLNTLEKNKVKIWFQPKEWVVSTRDLIDQMETYISSYDSCWGRDALIANNLATLKKSSILFIGARHLPAQAHYLRKECLQQLSQSKAFQTKINSIVDQ